MKDTNTNGAPEGYIAVEPIEGCLGCAFDDDFSECFRNETEYRARKERNSRNTDRMYAELFGDSHE